MIKPSITTSIEASLRAIESLVAKRSYNRGAEQGVRRTIDVLLPSLGAENRELIVMYVLTQGKEK